MPKKEPAPPSQPVLKFDLAGVAPSISEHGNTIREANQNDFPALAGNGVAFDVFAQTFEVSPDVFNNFNESNKFFAPARKK